MRVMRTEEAPSAALGVKDERLEQALLSALLKGARMDECPVPAEAISHPLHRTVYEAMETAAERLGAVDVPAVRATLTRGGASAEVVALAEALGAGDGNPANLSAYVAGLLELHEKREAIRAMESGIQQLARPDARAVLVCNEVAARLGAAGLDGDGKEGRGGDDARALLADIEEARRLRQEQSPRLRAFLPMPYSGFNGKDNPMRGFPSQKGGSCVGVIAAKSGKGKTAAAATKLHYWLCELGIVCGLVGLEDGTRWLIDRWVARDFGLDWGNVVEDAASAKHYVMPFQVPWFPEDWAESHPETGAPCFSLERAVECYAYLLDQRLYRYAGGGIASPALLALARKWERQGVQGILVDHGLQVDYTPGADERLDLAIKRGVKALNWFTMQTGVPVLLMWHLNRKGDDDAPPTMDDVKESGYLDAFSSTMLGIYYHSGSSRTLMNVMKSRKSGGHGLMLECVWAGRSGMFHPSQCQEVDLRAEARKAKEQRKAEREGKQRVFG